jgi:Ca2+-binding EF-hand superfamily protein
LTCSRVWILIALALCPGLNSWLGSITCTADEVEDIEAEVDKIMREVDTDRSGEIDYSEFVAASLNRAKLLSRERLEAAFKAFDTDGSGTITADELKAMLGKQHAYDDDMWVTISSGKWTRMEMESLT